MIQAVIFDMDGLMINSEVVTFEGYVEICKNYGASLDRDTYLKCLGKPVRAIHQVFYDAYGDDFPIVDIMKQNHARMAHVFETQGVPLKPGLRNLLDYLKAHDYQICIATSSTRDRVDTILKLAGLQEYFDASICGNEVEHGKPAPDIFLNAAAKLGRAPEECLVLEDSEMGILASHRAGIPVVCIPDMKEPEPDFAEKTAAILPDLQQVIGWLQTQA